MLCHVGVHTKGLVPVAKSHGGLDNVCSDETFALSVIAKKSVDGST